MVLNLFRMWDAVFGGFELAVKYFASVTAGEVARFGNGIKDLDFGCAVNGKVIDRFMGNRIMANIWGRGEHAKHGFGIGESNWVSLDCRRSALTWR